MAYTTNDLADIAPVILKEGQVALRENAIAARLMLFDVKKEVAQKGSTINVEIPSAIPSQEVDVTSVNTPTVLAPTIVPVTLDQWYEAPFEMSDKDIGDVKEGTIPMAVTEAIKSLSNNVDDSLLALYKDIYGIYGTAGTTPSAVSDVTQPRMILNKQLAPLGGRALLLDPETEAEFLELDTFTNLDKTGETAALKEGSLGKKFGFDIHMDQNMPYHTKGTLAAQTSIASKAIVAVGAETMTLDDSAGGTLTGTMVKGDSFTFANDTTTYVCSATATAATAEIVITFQPPLVTATANGTVVTMVASHAINLAFNSQAFCFASRPLQVANGLGSIILTDIDPISGIALRLEISRDARLKKTIWSYDILWGVKTIRPEFACRLIG